MTATCQHAGRRAAWLVVALLPACFASEPATAADDRTFQNPILHDAADPWVIRHTDGFYYLCSSANHEISLTRSRSLTGLAEGERKVIRARRHSGPSSRQVWAPELHLLDGAWYVYFAASDGENANHRMFVIENRSADPFSGEFIEKGQILDPADDVWAIDGSVLDWQGQRYFLWSSARGEELDPQVVRIARMTNPWTLASPGVEISRPRFDWERRGDPDVNEGPQPLIHGDRLFVIYSASGSWTDHYCLGQLALRQGGDPLDPNAWTKNASPVFESANGVYGPGHCSFTKSPDGTEDWIVYHAAREKGSGWDRNVRTQPFNWTDDGNPRFGVPLPVNQPLMKPGGE